MKGMIFAAGLGTRLAPLTDTCPKALIPVGDKPMLRRVIERMREAGVADIVVNVHHHADMIKRYLRENDFGVSVRVSDESEALLDTGGGVVKAMDMLAGDEPIMLYNADIYTTFPIGEMLSSYESSGADVVLLVGERDTSRYLLMDEDGYMRGWKNVSTGEVRSPEGVEVPEGCVPRAFGGVHIISPKVLDVLKEYKPEGKFSITPFYIDMCVRLKIRGYTPASGYSWIDIGKPETLAKAREIAKMHDAEMGGRE